MKNKTIDKILVRLYEIASILKQAKKEGTFNTHDDELDALARRLDSHKIDHEVEKADTNLPVDYSMEEYIKFKKFLKEQNVKPSEEVKEEPKKKKVPKIFVSEDDILTPVSDFLVFDIKDLYNAVIHMKELYKEHFRSRVFDYTEVRTILRVFKSSLMYRWYKFKWCHIETTNESDFNSSVRARNAMFTGGWYNYLALDGICPSDGMRMVATLKEKGVFYQLLSSMLAVEEHVEKNAKPDIFTHGFDYSSLSYDDYDNILISSQKLYRRIIAGEYGSDSE